MDKKRVLILGGGFGGIYAALEFEKRRDPDLEVTLISQENFFLFTPMLHEVAASDLDLTHIVNPIRKMLRHVRFFTGEVLNVNLPQRQVVFAHGFNRHQHAFDFDALVFSLGNITNFYGIPGLTDCAVTMKSLGDAIRLRNRLIAHLEEADTECAAGDREPLLTFVVAGGGFAGVETIGCINDLLRGALPYYRNLKQAMLRVVLVYPGDFVLPELGEALGRYTTRKLAERGVELHPHTKITAASPGEVRLSDGTLIKTSTLVWTAGTSPHPLLQTLQLPKQNQRILVNTCLQVNGSTDLWALGDCALVPDGKGGFQPPTAQHASREGKVLAHNILAYFRNQPLREFRFDTLGLLASIGRRTGVARIFGVNVSGFLAWWLWRTIYLLKLPRTEKKLRVTIDWTLDVLFSRDFVQYIQERSPTMSEEEIPDTAGTRAADAPTPECGRIPAES